MPKLSSRMIGPRRAYTVEAFRWRVTVTVAPWGVFHTGWQKDSPTAFSGSLPFACFTAFRRKYA